MASVVSERRAPGQVSEIDSLVILIIFTGASRGSCCRFVAGCSKVKSNRWSAARGERRALAPTTVSARLPIYHEHPGTSTSNTYTNCLRCDRAALPFQNSTQTSSTRHPLCLKAFRFICQITRLSPAAVGLVTKSRPVAEAPSSVRPKAPQYKPFLLSSARNSQ